MKHPKRVAALLGLVLMCGACDQDRGRVPAIEGSAIEFVSLTRVPIDEQQAPWGKALGDLDGNGQVDIVEAGGHLGGHVFWHRYPDWQKFEIGTVGGDDDVQLADLNRDGALDVVVNGGLLWYENPSGADRRAEGRWTAHTIDGANNGHDLALDDLDGDGRIDVVTRGEFGPTTVYLNNLGSRRVGHPWIRVPMSNGSDGEGTAIADLDGDSRPDIVANGYWLEQPPDPVHGTWTRHDFASWPRGSAVAVADINEDGRLDVFLSYSEVGVGELAWFEGPPDPHASAPWTKHRIGTVEDVHRFHLADMNRDGTLDLVYAEMHQSATRRLGIYYSQGRGQHWSHQVLAATGGHNIAIGDVGHDGDIDILVANWHIDSPDTGRLTSGEMISIGICRSIAGRTSPWIPTNRNRPSAFTLPISIATAASTFSPAATGTPTPAEASRPTGHVATWGRGWT